MQSVNFAPNNKQQVRELLRYLDKHSGNVQVQRKDPAYIAAVHIVRSRMRQHFEKFPPVLSAADPWRTLGTYEECRTIAQQYSVPAWTVLADANPYREF